jgi:hypothetical protein
MEEETKLSDAQRKKYEAQLVEAEQFVEKIKAELYANLGKITFIKELLNEKGN